MKKITCKKPCNIGGTRFAIGDAVPNELVAPDREATLIRYGLIAVEDVPDATANAPAINTPGGSESSTQELTGGQQQPESNTDDGGKKKAGKKVSK